MTNIVALLFITFSTNCHSITTLPDNNRLCEYEVIADVVVNHSMPDGFQLRLTNRVVYSKLSRTEPPHAPDHSPRPITPPIPPTGGAGGGVPAPTVEVPPVPVRTIRTTLPTFTAASEAPFIMLPPRFANGGPDEANYSRMFRLETMTKTNRIYGLQSSADFITWELCQPEINGTGAQEFFFDAPDGAKSYRIVSREGVLPE